MAKKARKKKANNGNGSSARYPRHSIEKALRIPRAIIEQNAGKECSDRDSARFAGVGFNGPYKVELSSALKYGFLTRQTPGHVTVTDRARQAIRPQKLGDEIDAFRQAILDAPDISEVYKHYRGENLPDGTFFENALVDKFGIPAAEVPKFTDIFLSSLKTAHLLEPQGDKQRVLDITDSSERTAANPSLKKAARDAKIDSNETCFVVMPFAEPIGGYFSKIYEPAIRKAGLRPVRADADIFGTGKIIDQIWSGINSARVLVAEMTTRNANVFYELGLAHALQKPVVLVSSNEADVPFDLKHIRVIYYDVSDPFWGEKLIDKVAENIVSALKNPDEAIFQRALESS
ncbi:MAG: hypothetical protein J0H71_15915 [Rhizobiales bacterium]|nr:hypothetical protein [Hyphomicrobiales bacterium]